MIRHDQLFKELLREYFGDFLRLAAPGTASQLDLERTAATGLTRTGRRLLVNCVETYLKLNPEEAAEYQVLEAAEENREVREMAKTWADEMIAKGRAEGRVEGRSEGRAEGRSEGRAEGAREVVLRLLGRRFGPLPEEVRRRVEAISSPETLARLADRVLAASSLEEMGLA